MAFRVPEPARLTKGEMGSDASYGNNGVFIIRLSVTAVIHCIASDSGGWEHVSAHVADKAKMRMPTWPEMCKVKDIFWEAEDVCVQFHPKQSEYVNNHPYVLHIWRKKGRPYVGPPYYLVGLKR